MGKVRAEKLRGRRAMRSYIHAITGGACLAALAFAAGEAVARDITLPMDEVRIVTFPAPVATVYVGNPSIADVTVIDSRRVFLMGKSFGTTNIVALDSKGNATMSQRVTVYGRPGGTVTLHRGAAQFTFACAEARCEAVPVQGDARDPFEAVSSQREKLASGAQDASGSRAGGGQ
jgi:Flp pilus assembly secretin CpaC